MTEPQTAGEVWAQIPWGRLFVVAIVTAVAATFAQRLVTGESNAAVTAGITGALTATLGVRRKSTDDTPSDAES